MRIVLGYCPDLTDPHATMIEVGALRLRGDRFVEFAWWLDYRGLGLDPFTETIFQMWPDSMRNLVAQWPAFRDRAVPEHLKLGDPDNIVDFVSHTLSRSSISVVRVERDPEACAA